MSRVDEGLRPNWYLVIPCSFLLTGIPILALWRALVQGPGEESGGVVWFILFIVLWLAILGGAVIGTVRQVRTSVSNEAIRQRGVVGEKLILWEDVVRVTGKMGGLKIESKDEWIAIIPDLFRNSRTVESLVRKLVDAHRS